MARVTCPGLPASWINAWLAAVGATVLDSGIRLHWTAETALAVLSAEVRITNSGSLGYSDPSANPR